MATDSPGWEFDKFDDGSLSKLFSRVIRIEKAII